MAAFVAGYQQDTGHFFTARIKFTDRITLNRGSQELLTGLFFLNEFDFVSVGVFDECNHRCAVLHRPRLASYFAAHLLGIFAGLVSIVHFDGNVTEAITKVVR